MINILDKPTPKEIIVRIAARLRVIRRRRKISQVRLAKISGVSLSSLKRFERTGEISLLSLSKIVFALNRSEELDSLFVRKEYLSMDEVVREYEISQQNRRDV